MAEAGPSSAQDTGPSGRVRGLVQAGLRYGEVRARLFQIEAQEAGSHLSRVSTRGVMAVSALMVAWMLAVPALVSLAAELLKQHWPWMRWEYVALAVAVLHLLIGFILLLAAKRRWARVRLFEESLNQFQKDREWLARNSTPPN